MSEDEGGPAWGKSISLSLRETCALKLRPIGLQKGKLQERGARTMEHRGQVIERST